MVGLAACCSKADEQARLVEREVCFTSDAGSWEEEGVRHLFKGQLPPLPLATSGARAFIDRAGRELHTETAQWALRVIFRLVHGGLTSIISVALGTVNLQFQGPFVPVSLWPVLGIGQLVSWVQSGHHVGNLSTWCFSICKTAHRIGLRILSIVLEKELKVPDMLNDYMTNIWSPLTGSLFFLCFSFLWLNLFFD